MMIFLMVFSYCGVMVHPNLFAWSSIYHNLAGVFGNHLFLPSLSLVVVD